MEFAVNIPEHDPQVGHAACSTVSRDWADTASEADAEIAVTRSVGACATPSTTTALPASISTGDEYHGDVQPHRGIEHAGRDLVAVRDTHQCIRGVAIDHVLDGVGNNLARRQRVQHATVPHSNAIVNGNGVKFAGHTAGFSYGFGDDFTHVLQVDVARNELRVGVRDGDDGLLEVAIGHTRRTPQGTRAGGVAALGGDSGTEGDCVHR